MKESELLCAIEDVVQKIVRAETAPIKSDIQDIKCGIEMLKEGLAKLQKEETESMREKGRLMEVSYENDMLPRIQNIESCYLSTFERYKTGAEQMDSVRTDVMMLKKVVAGHSEKLGRIV